MSAKAIISDIHANLEALQAVFRDIESQDIQQVYCLGDVVGYGPNPCECVDLVMKKCSVTLLGNHDQGALFDPEGFNVGAEQAIFWTRKTLDAAPSRDAQRRWDFIGELPRVHTEGDIIFVHGSPRNPLNEYVFPEDIYNQRKMERIFGLVKRACFVGHTHIPGVFTETLNFLSPEEIDYEYKLGNEKAIINVGSVGQPRDGIPLASYVTFDGEVVRFRRVEYDVEKTIQKIYAIAELDNFLGDRLRDGR